MNARGLSRRDLLKGVSSGFGYLAFAGLVVDGGRGGLEGLAARAQGPALPGSSQSSDLPLHERGTLARRYVRL